MLADAGASTGVVTWAPLLVAGGGLVVAFVTGFSRRDQRQINLVSSLDQRTQTALKALSESLAAREADLDRAIKERDEWRDRATANARRADAAEQRIEDLMAEIVHLKAQLVSRRRRNMPPDASYEVT